MITDIQGSNASASSSLPATEGSLNAIGIIYGRFNLFALGTIIAVTKRYVDKVYLASDMYDDRIAELAHSLGVELLGCITSTTWDRIRLEHGESSIVALYGDGTHNPYDIPLLLGYLSDGHDLAVGMSGRSDPQRDTIVLMNHRDPAQETSGFMAFSTGFAGRQVFHSFRDLAKGNYLQLNGANVRVKLVSLGVPGKFRLYNIGVVVPAYNEEILIEETIKSVPEYVKKIYVVDDGSNDRTREVVGRIKDPRIVFTAHAKNRGVGAALITGYKKAREDQMDIVAVMAGDNQMDPAQLPRLLMPIIEGRADYTKGNRLISKEFRKGMSRWRSFGNQLLTMITKIGSGYWHVADPQNGYTAISREALEAMDLDAIYTYYGYCNDLLIKLNAFGMVVEDVAIPAKYGREKSSIRYSRFIFKVAPMIFRGFLWRLKTKYILLDFHPLVLLYAASMILLPLGLLMFAWAGVEKVETGIIAPSLLLLAALVLLSGLQFLLLAMALDRQEERQQQNKKMMAVDCI